jgi:hypothetical protein
MKFNFEVHEGNYRFDAVGHADGIVASVELKKHLGQINADWWISGLNKEGALTLLARVEVGHGAASTEREALAALPDRFSDLIQPMIETYKQFGGITSALNGPSVDTKQALCQLHLNMHSLEGTIGEQHGIRINVARQYQLIKSFGLKAARPLIAKREGLPISTVSRRLYLAREDGILQKLSDVDDINS